MLLAIGACGGDAASEARELQQQGRFAESLALLRDALADRPADAELNFLYGAALVRTGQAGLAVWPLTRASEDPDYAVPAGLQLAGALLQGGSATDAIAATDRVLAIAPDNLEARVLHARARVDAVHNEEALAELDALIEEWPDDARLRALRIVPLLRMGRVDEAGEALAELRSLVGKGELRDPIIEAHFCAAEATFLHERSEDEKAGEAWERCLEEHPQNPTVMWGVVDFYRTTGRSDSARKLLERSLAEQPRSTEIRIALAEQLRAEGKAEEGRRLMEEGAREDPSPDSWSALADYHVTGRDYPAARVAIERAIEMLPATSEELRFAYADVLILAGDLDAAEPIVESLDLPVQRDLLRGRIQLARGDARAAFESFEKGIRLWPNNAAARHLAGQAAEQLGDFEEAVSQYREAVRVDAGATEAALDLASLQRALGTPNLAIEPMRLQLTARPRDVAARREWVRLLFETGDRAGAQRALGVLRGLDPRAAIVVAAELRGERDGPAGVASVIEASELDLADPRNAELLAAWVDARIAAGTPGPALAVVESALESHPDSPSLHALRGRVLRAQGDPAGARASFERALALDSDRATVLLELGGLAESEGETEEALVLYDRALAADPGFAEAAFAAARLEASRGARDRALDRFEAVLRIAPHHLEAAREVALLRAADAADLDRALAAARRAAVLGRESVDLETLGAVQVARGEGAAATATLRDALEKDPGNVSARYWLGRALVLTDDADAAREAFRQALASGDPDEVQRARVALAKLDGEDAP